MNNCEGIGRRIEGIFSHKRELAEIAAGIPVWINFAETGARVDHIYFEFNNSITQGGFTVPRRENLAPQSVGAHGFRGNARCGALPQHFSNPPSETPPAHSLPHFSRNFMRFLRDVLTPHNSCPRCCFDLPFAASVRKTTCLNNGYFQTFSHHKNKSHTKRFHTIEFPGFKWTGMVIFPSHSLSSPCGKNSPSWSMPRTMQILRKHQNWRPGHQDLLIGSSPKALKAKR